MRPHVCHICSKAYLRRCELHVHLSRVHSENAQASVPVSPSLAEPSKNNSVTVTIPSTSSAEPAATTAVGPLPAMLTRNNSVVATAPRSSLTELSRTEPVVSAALSRNVNASVATIALSLPSAVPCGSKPAVASVRCVSGEDVKSEAKPSHGHTRRLAQSAPATASATTTAAHQQDDTAATRIPQKDTGRRYDTPRRMQQPVPPQHIPHDASAVPAASAATEGIQLLTAALARDVAQNAACPFSDCACGPDCTCARCAW